MPYSSLFGFAIVKFIFSDVIFKVLASDSSAPNKLNDLISFGSFVLQFIVVSLKEGMFNNTNVLFRTKFVDVFASSICYKSYTYVHLQGK